MRPGTIQRMEEEDPWQKFQRDYLKIDDAKGNVLAEMQEQLGGSSQGTLVMAEFANGENIMVEQQTNNAVGAMAENVGAEYIKQKRMSGFHAEMRLIRYLIVDRGLGQQGARDFCQGANIWVSKPICGKCAEQLLAYGFTLQSPANNVAYSNWVDPHSLTVSTTVEDGNFVVRRRLTEAERLKKDASGWK